MHHRLRSRHFRQMGLFVLAGVAQVALDSTIFVLGTALGLPVAPGNVLGRLSGASLGYWLNGRYTFADNGAARHSRRHLGRFAVAWCSLTAVSTVLLHTVAARVDLHTAWLAKPFVEAMMAGVGFIVWRQWVFR